MEYFESILTHPAKNGSQVNFPCQLFKKDSIKVEGTKIEHVGPNSSLDYSHGSTKNWAANDRKPALF